MTPVVRAARPEEAAALSELAAATFPLACPPGTTAEDMADFIDTHFRPEHFAGHLGDDDRVILVADDAGALVGYTLLVFGEPEDADVARAVALRPTAELSKCYVLPDSQGSGTASALVAATVLEAEDRGMMSVWLGVNQHNARANAFYAKSGFAQVGTKRFRVGAQLHHDFVRERVLRDG